MDINIIDTNVYSWKIPIDLKCENEFLSII